MSELLNRTIGGYQLLEHIGGGGVATVYRAQQTTGGSREVAVKIIYPEFARQPGVAANFSQITRMATQLANHPHILPVIGSGEDHEYLYLVTPLVKEGTLSDWLAKGGRLGVSDVGPFFQQLCGAVSYAHSLGLTHGNIKPSNVYLYEGRHVLLGDFGLLWDVRALDPSWSGSDVAAFEYLAPEVFDGRITPSCDIYSLGASLFATLTGHAPFHADRLGDLITAARQQVPPSLAQETPAPAPAIVTLDAVVRQAMAKQLEQRYPSAAMLGQAIEATLRQAAQSGLSASSAQVGPLPAAPPAGFGAASTPALVGPQPWGPVAPSQAAQAPAGMNAPLAQLEPPFPALPPMAGPDQVVDPRGVGVVTPGAGAVFAAPPTQRVEPAPPSGIVDAPTARVAAPLDGPTARVSVPPSSGVVDAPTMQVSAPPLNPGIDADLDLEFAAGPPTPRRGLAGLADGRSRPVGQSPEDEFEPPSGAQSGQFSATELGLPRLTNPAMGDLPPDWRELISDESARRRHDPFSMSESALAPLPPIEHFDSSRDDLDVMAHSQSDIKRSGWEEDEWGASSDRRDWGASDSEKAWVAEDSRQPWETSDQGAGVAVAGKRGAQADYDIERMAVERPSKRRGARDDISHDTLQAQKVWTNSRTIVRGKRPAKAPFFTIVALLALTALELAGLAVVRPDICVTHACATVAGYAHRLAPSLRIPGITAPVHLTPTVPQVTVVTEGSSKITFTLANSSADPITWSAKSLLTWMSVSPTSGSLKGGEGVPLTVTVSPHGVAPGVYTAALAVYVGYGMSVEPVVVTVKPGAELSVAPRSLTFTHCGQTQELTLSNTGGGKLTYTASPSQANALSVNPSSGALTPGATKTLSVSMSCDAPTGAMYAVIIVSNGGSAQIGVTYS
jgi:hypothetical protein